MKTIIERGASWTLEETKLLLALWGQDLVQRQTTNQKRTKEVYERISEKFNQSGFERTADQVRTRVFNMIAEYRRILKDPNPERMKKCIFFEALHKIYQAKHMDDVKSALDDYEPECPYSPASNTISSEKGDESISDSEATDGNDITINNQSTATNNNNSGNNSNSAPSTAANNITVSATNDNNGDSINCNTNDTNSINNNITEKESSLNSHQASAKKIKLESPKSSTSQTTNSLEHAAVNTKQNKSSSTQAGTSIANNTSSASSSSSSIAATTATTSTSTSATTSSNLKHQSLLLPHATSNPSTASTPITKLSSGGNTAPSYININSTKLPIIRTNQLIGHSNGNDSINLNGTATTRLPTTAAITSHQLYQAPVNTFDVTSSALLIDRMFAHLSRESENMREWIALEKERLALERARRAQETEREVRRERVLIDTLMRFQEQWISFLTRLGPGIIENAPEPPPELKLPLTEGAPTEISQTTSGTQSTANTSSTGTSMSTSTSTASGYPSTTSSGASK